MELVINPLEKTFLGPEFLTWLYFVMRGDLAVDGSRMAIGTKIGIRDMTAVSAKVSLQGQGLDDNGEILQAIRRGGCIDSLSMSVAVGERVYQFMIFADGTLASVKLPDVMDEPKDDDGEGDKKRRKPDNADICELRMMLLDELEGVLDNLVAEFTTRRLSSDAWSRDEREMLQAVAEGLEQRRLTEVR